MSLTPEWWWFAALAGILFLVALVLAPLTFRFQLQGQGEPQGAWALAGAVQVGPVVMSAVAARRVSAKAQAHLFGRVVWSRDLADAEPDDSEEALRERLKRHQKSLSKTEQRISRWFDWLDLTAFAWDLRRRIRLAEGRVELAYSFSDILLTGKLYGALCVLSALVSPLIVVDQTPSWESLDRVSVSASGKVRTRPGLMLVDAILFVIRNIKLKRRAEPMARASGAP